MGRGAEDDILSGDGLNGLGDGEERPAPGMDDVVDDPFIVATGHAGQLLEVGLEEFREMSHAFRNGDAGGALVESEVTPEGFAEEGDAVHAGDDGDAAGSGEAADVPGEGGGIELGGDEAFAEDEVELFLVRYSRMSFLTIFSEVDLE